MIICYTNKRKLIQTLLAGGSGFHPFPINALAWGHLNNCPPSEESNKLAMQPFPLRFNSCLLLKNFCRSLIRMLIAHIKLDSQSAQWPWLNTKKKEARPSRQKNLSVLNESFSSFHHLTKTRSATKPVSNAQLQGKSESNVEKRQYFLYLNVTIRALTVKSAPEATAGRLLPSLPPTDSTALQAQHCTHKRLPGFQALTQICPSCIIRSGGMHGCILLFGWYFEGYIQKEPHLCNRRWPHGNQGNSTPVNQKTSIIGCMACFLLNPSRVLSWGLHTVGT